MHFKVRVLASRSYSWQCQNKKGGHFIIKFLMGGNMIQLMGKRTRSQFPGMFFIKKEGWNRLGLERRLGG